ncbi:MBL fold metallo-hydrolase [Chloroflexota bacterium]
MNQRDNPVRDDSAESPCEIVKEKLKGSGAVLTNFYFTYGANFYVISYSIEGRTRHTFIDTSARQYRGQVQRLLFENNIDVADIENIIISHSHSDHYGLADDLASKSGGRILVHQNFRMAMEKERGKDEEKWWDDFELSELARHSMVYLSPRENNAAQIIGGLEFLKMGPPLDIGGARLNILTCPEVEATHTVDQIILHYSPRENLPFENEEGGEFRTDDDMIFSGDLWLMTEPKFRSNLRLRHHRSDSLQRRKSTHEHQEQDYAAKDALKKGFGLIKVKPGHGGEFIGSRIITISLLADRDLLPELGYSRNANKSLLKREDLGNRITYLQERAYQGFVEELVSWFNVGYSPEEITGFLVRIYREQSGGSKSIEQDRKERRVRLVANLTSFKHDRSQPSELNQIGDNALTELGKVV